MFRDILREPADTSIWETAWESYKAKQGYTSRSEGMDNPRCGAARLDLYLLKLKVLRFALAREPFAVAHLLCSRSSPATLLHAMPSTLVSNVCASVPIRTTVVSVCCMLRHQTWQASQSSQCAHVAD